MSQTRGVVNNRDLFLGFGGWESKVQASVDLVSGGGVPFLVRGRLSPPCVVVWGRDGEGSLGSPS